MNQHIYRFKVAIYGASIHTTHVYKREFQILPEPAGLKVAAGAETGATEDISISTRIWFSAEISIPVRLKAAQASMKFSEIKTRKFGFLDVSMGGSAACGSRFP